MRETNDSPFRRHPALAGGIVLLSFLGVVEILLAWVGPRFVGSGRRLPASVVEALAGMGWEPNAADRRLLRADSQTLWALVPNYEGWVPTYVANGSPWFVRIGPHGYRGDPPATSPPPDLYRVACVGNSCTFGLLVDEDDTYPAHLEDLLSRRHPERPVEVCSFAVPGYSSEQGRVILERDVLPVQPDLVIISFGFNDSWPAAVTDSVRFVQARRLPVRLRTALERLATFRLLEHLLDSIAPAQVPGPGGATTVRVPPHRMARHLRAMIRSARATGAQVVLLNQDYATGGTSGILARVAAEAGIPFIDARRLLLGAPGTPLAPAARSLFEVPPDGAATRADLAADRSPDSVQVVLEVGVPSRFPRPITVVGNLPQLGGGRPGRVILPDDGVGTDREAGDGVHTLAFRAPAGHRLRYLYFAGPDVREWGGAEHPACVRDRTVPAEPVTFRDRFGRLSVMAEPIHPTGLGYEAVALALADVVDSLMALGPPQGGGG